MTHPQSHGEKMSQQVLESLFGVSRPVIAMAHFPPLPGTPLHDGNNGVAGLVDAVARDVEILEDAGFDAVLFCNEGDRPYAFQAGPEAASAMSWIIAHAKPKKIPFGVDHLYDSQTALAVGHATGAAFIRTVCSGAYESDMGLWSPDLAGLLRYRRSIDASDMKIFMNVTPEFASTLGKRSVGTLARSAVINGLADAILIAGPLAGAEVDLDPLDDAQKALAGSAPVLVTTGVSSQTLSRYIPRFDGVIVGTSLKVDSHTWNPVDPGRAARFMEEAHRIRNS
jgi:membrane complex biogenesis BtpA family protein